MEPHAHQAEPLDHETRLALERRPWWVSATETTARGLDVVVLDPQCPRPVIHVWDRSADRGVLILVHFDGPWLMVVPSQLAP